MFIQDYVQGLHTTKHIFHCLEVYLHQKVCRVINFDAPVSKTPVLTDHLCDVHNTV